MLIQYPELSSTPASGACADSLIASRWSNVPLNQRRWRSRGISSACAGWQSNEHNEHHWVYFWTIPRYNTYLCFSRSYLASLWAEESQQLHHWWCVERISQPVQWRCRRAKPQLYTQLKTFQSHQLQLQQLSLSSFWSFTATMDKLSKEPKLNTSPGKPTP